MPNVNRRSDPAAWVGPFGKRGRFEDRTDAPVFARLSPGEQAIVNEVCSGRRHEACVACGGRLHHFRHDFCAPLIENRRYGYFARSMPLATDERSPRCRAHSAAEDHDGGLVKTVAGLTGNSHAVVVAIASGLVILLLAVGLPHHQRDRWARWWGDRAPAESIRFRHPPAVAHVRFIPKARPAGLATRPGAAIAQERSVTPRPTGEATSATAPRLTGSGASVSIVFAPELSLRPAIIPDALGPAGPDTLPRQQAPSDSASRPAGLAPSRMSDSSGVRRGAITPASPEVSSAVRIPI